MKGIKNHYVASFKLREIGISPEVVRRWFKKTMV